LTCAIEVAPDLVLAQTAANSASDDALQGQQMTPADVSQMGTRIGAVVREYRETKAMKTDETDDPIRVTEDDGTWTADELAICPVADRSGEKLFQVHVHNEIKISALTEYGLRALRALIDAALAPKLPF
jgi:hypothetical protein